MRCAGCDHEMTKKDWRFRVYDRDNNTEFYVCSINCLKRIGE